VEAVIRQLGPGRKAVLLAFSDSTLLPLLEEGRFLVKRGLYLLPLNPDHFAIALDKACTLRLAQSLNVEVPPTWSCGTELELQQISGELAFPLVLKPRRSIYSIGNAVIHKTAIFAFSPRISKENLRLFCLRPERLPYFKNSFGAKKRE
jgi:carbamoylphosphate synthase large subunit